MKREIPLIITTIAGLVFALSYFIPRAPFSNAETIFSDWVTIVQAFAIWLGLLNLVMVSTKKISRGGPESTYSIVILVSLVATLVVGFISGFSGINANPPYAYNDNGTGFDWIFRNVFGPLGATMFAILAFYVASAAYRAFRARNKEATLLLIAAFFVMGGRVPLLDLAFSPLGIFQPLGQAWFGNDNFFSSLSGWIMQNPVTAGQRAIAIGIALGIMSSSLRVILGIERSHIGGEA